MGQKYVTIAEETLAMAGVGVWTVEMDPGKEPRLYADKVMKRLIGSEGEVTAEEDYHKWYAGVVPEFLKPVLQYVQNIVDTGRDQIVYPWDYPDGRRIYIRCGGVRDNEYNGPGVRIRGYHVDITENKQKEEQQQKALLEAYEAAQKLQSIPKNANPIRLHNRCKLTGRPRGYIRFFGLSRIQFREMASSGLIPGVKKASW